MEAQTVVEILRSTAVYAFVAAIIVQLVTVVRRFYRKKYRSVGTASTPVLLAKLLDGGELVRLMHGFTPRGYKYSYLVGSDFQAYGVYSVELPFVSAAHIVGITKKAGDTFSIDQLTSTLEPTTLEGNYSETFSVYVERFEQDDGRYVIDPKAMKFTLDFCRKYHWEILDDCLYFMNRGSLPPFEIIDQFIEEIMPAIDSKKPVERNSAKIPYGELRSKTVNCPICQKTLLPNAGYLA